MNTPSEELLISLHQRPKLMDRYSETFAGLSPQDAYSASEALHRYRIQQGWKAAGRKIGLTNRAMWARFGVSEPIWGTVYDHTLVDAPDGSTTLDIGGLLQPRIEPEICFGLKYAPFPGADNLMLLDSIDWIAHSIEIVQCPQPDWKLNLGASIAFNAMHARLVIGKRVPLSGIPEAEQALLKCEVDLRKNGVLVERGKAIDVLDSPLNALAHIANLIRSTPGARPLGHGEVVTTGSMTLAYSIAPGETWTSTLEGFPLPELKVRFN